MPGYRADLRAIKDAYCNFGCLVAVALQCDSAVLPCLVIHGDRVAEDFEAKSFPTSFR